MDAEATGLAVLEAQRRALEEGPAVFLERTGLDSDGFREVAEIFAERRAGKKPRHAATPVQADLQVGYHLAKVLEEG